MREAEYVLDALERAVMIHRRVHHRSPLDEGREQDAGRGELERFVVHQLGQPLPEHPVPDLVVVLAEHDEALGGHVGHRGAVPATAVVGVLTLIHVAVTVPAGQPVNVTLNNTDPIEHEWIVGTEEVHERHRNGTDGYHNQIPTEVTIPALTTSKTMVRFDTPGDYPFICHLPGHEAYGMKGILRVQ